jgi:hypothetical protein
MMRTLIDYTPETEMFEDEGLGAGAPAALDPGVLAEDESLALAVELMEVSDAAELDRFMGKLIGHAAQASGPAAAQAVRGPAGAALSDLLKGAARRILPITAAAGRSFGLELEGLSEEDGEFEVAKSYVRFAAEATRNLAAASVALAPLAAARKAAADAARRRAPGLLRSFAAGGAPLAGRWQRRGRHLIVLM